MTDASPRRVVNLSAAHCDVGLVIISSLVSTPLAPLPPPVLPPHLGLIRGVGAYEISRLLFSLTFPKTLPKEICTYAPSRLTPDGVLSHLEHFLILTDFLTVLKRI